MTVTPELVLERAREYVRLNLSVIPLQVRGKKPLVPWKAFQTRYPKDSELVSWFGPDNEFGFIESPNIGIVTGGISGITVIDCDSLDATMHARKLGLPDGPTVKTARGWHFYFAYADGVGNFQKRDDLPGIDLRGDGGFVVAPPSTHESGAVYRWENESLIAQRKLAALPAWVLASQPVAMVAGSSVAVGSSANVVKLPVSDLLEQGATEGNRNNTLARLVGHWASTMPFESAVELAQTWNRSRCHPPLESREVERTVRSIYAKEHARRQSYAGAGWIRETPDSAAIDLSGKVDSGTPRDLAAEQSVDDYVIRIPQLEPEIWKFYEHGLTRGVATGWRQLDEFYTVRKREWTLVTGQPGHGKSSWVDQLAVNLAQLHDWRFAVYSAENMPYEQYTALLLEKWSQEPFNRGKWPRMEEETVRNGLAFLREHFLFLNPPEERNTVRTILEILSRLITSEPRLDAIIVDPWNELDHSRPATEREDEYLSRVIGALRRFVRTHDLHLFVVAHPRRLEKDSRGIYPVPTPYDVAGGAMWRNKADNCIAIHRVMDYDENGQSVDRGVSEIHVQKIRFRHVGKIGMAQVYFDRLTGRFDENRVMRTLPTTGEQ